MDSLQRHQFCCDINHDFSVIAPAGVGKTFSIIERIYSIADRSPEDLACLYVITYTKKAAESLQKRAFERIKQHPKFRQLSYFLDQSFFDTIHSLCWNHIRKFDVKHYELLLDDDSLKKSFLWACTKKYSDNKAYKEVLRFVDLDAFLNVIDEIPCMSFQPLKVCSENDFSPELAAIYQYRLEPRNLAAITRKQQEVQTWEKQYQQESMLVIPECSTGGEKFKQVFYETFEPFFAWLGEKAYHFARELARDYFDYRLANGYLKHSDLIDHARNLLNEQRVQDFFKQQKISILLDEAQDTDANQFQYLQVLYALNPENRFSMVGDPQQSIYARADLQYYLNLHKKLVHEGKCRELIFSQTFRCPENIVKVLNQTFPNLLNSKIDHQQVNYVELVSASKSLGEYREIEIPKPLENENLITYELQYLVQFLKEYQRKAVGDLSQIGLLCPRNDWLQEIQTYLLNSGFPMQLYSHHETFRDNPFFCTILAFIHLLNFPDDAFEIAGMLYGVFCCSEKDITLYEDVLQVEHTLPKVGEIQVVLNSLVDLRKGVLEESLWKGILKIIHFFSPYCPERSNHVSCRNIILETVSQAQQLGQSWPEIERKLYQYLDTAIEEVMRVDSKAIQGYSCYKAKGLEWDTVIVPFFYRPIRHHQMQYPCIFKHKLVFNKNAKDFSSELYLSRKRELQRLLYVTCTRAKKNLIILQDKELWKREENAPSFGDLWDENR